MRTHILYSQDRDTRIYFSGIYEDRIDDTGVYGYIQWEWSEDINCAQYFTSTDAWDLLRRAREEFPNTIIEVKRMRTLEEIQRDLSGCAMDL